MWIKQWNGLKFKIIHKWAKENQKNTKQTSKPAVWSGNHQGAPQKNGSKKIKKIKKERELYKSHQAQPSK